MPIFISFSLMLVGWMLWLGVTGALVMVTFSSFVRRLPVWVITVVGIVVAMLWIAFSTIVFGYTIGQHMTPSQIQLPVGF